MTKDNYRRFQQNLLNWYDQNKRDLPWRREKTPYHIWVSEVMLQQTRVSTVLRYYDKFIRRFPSVETLAAADEAILLKSWEGLGYYRRVRNLHKAAQIIMEKYDGTIPLDYKSLIRLPGIGAYMAAAIASIAAGLPFAAVDGNVKRVLSRLKADKSPVNDSKYNQHFQRLADQMLLKQRPGDFNQAMMELGALICRPAQPLCDVCPVTKECRARKTNQTALYPFRISTRPKKSLHKIAFLPAQRESSVPFIWLVKRRNARLMEGFYELPTLEDTPENHSTIEHSGAIFLKEITHIYTHIVETWRLCQIEELPEIFQLKKNNIQKAEISQAKRLALSGITKKALQNAGFWKAIPSKERIPES